MKNAVIIHGTPSKEEFLDTSVPSCSNAHWLPWLQKQLLVNGIAAHTPEMPDAWNPQYHIWLKEFERYEIKPTSILVGHSCGGGFLLRWLSEHKNKHVGPVILVAPWLDPKREKTTDFFDFVIDPELATRTKKLVVFNSDNDFADIQESVRIIRASINNLKYREFSNYGHFCLNDLKSERFPELFEEIFAP